MNVFTKIAANEIDPSVTPVKPHSFDVVLGFATEPLSISELAPLRMAFNILLQRQLSKGKHTTELQGKLTLTRIRLRKIFLLSMFEPGGYSIGANVGNLRLVVSGFKTILNLSNSA
jgi:hypothetical protein